MDDRRGPVLAGSAALAGAAAALLAVVHGHPSLLSLLIAAVVVFGAIAIGALVSYAWSPLKDMCSKAMPVAEASKTLVPVPGKPFTARWRYITDGAAVASTLLSFNKSVSHPGHSLRQSQEAPAKLIVSVLVPCAPITHLPATSAVVNAFIDLLSGSIVGKLTSMVTHVGSSLSWHSYSTNGVFNNQAVLARASDDPEAPISTAILNLNDTSLNSQRFQDPERAELVITIEVRSGDGSKPRALNFAEWQAWFVQLLKVPDALAQILAEEIKTPTYGSPETRVGVRLEAYGDLTDLVDAGPAQPSAGSRPARTFPVYLVADRAGKPASAIAIDVLRGICDYGLHIHGYEALLDDLGSGDTP